MTPKSFFAFSAVTAALVVGAAMAVANRPAATIIPKDRPFVFAGLDAKLNDVSAIEIQDATRRYSVKRVGDGWGIGELNGYPAKFENVKTTLVQLSQLRYLEPKTSDPERFERLNLRDVSAKGAKSKKITVRDKGGKILAEGLIGRKNAELFGTDKGGMYMRIGGKKESWLIEGLVKLGSGPADWVSKKIIDINGGAMRELVIDSPKGGKVRVSRKAVKDKNFKLGDIPTGKRQRGEWETNQMPKAFEGLQLIDLKRADEVDFGSGTYKGQWHTFDGLIIQSEAAKIGKKYWVRLSATAGENADEITKKRAASISARHKGFVYEIKEEVGKKLACEHINLLEGAGIKACA
ncbi:MAG: DUF4340 domain-containing protein [Rhodospirillaceae bacterium]|jgi:hypothetical protein|nr:DUF4340 domain-containing protein [Rhodospirillaceae bacterium]MBT5456912.1 DUF4340 domain-containing protein [Rhodospirillaceae bacterium]